MKTPHKLLVLFFFLVLIGFFFLFSQLQFNHVLFPHQIPVASLSQTSFFPKEALPTKSGYITINYTTGSAIFYTFYEAQEPISHLTQTPILIWLQGGPGCSSMYGNFLEIGPYRLKNFDQHSVHQPFELEPNYGAWNKKFGLLFLDNPIGSGFSVAPKLQEIPNNQLRVAKHLFWAINSFNMLYPSFKSRPIYIAGESYAGKYVPAIGYYILRKNEVLPARNRVNLGGVAIGNGLEDPITQAGTHALSAYYSGLINKRQKDEVERLQRKAIRLAKFGLWKEATNARYEVMDSLKDMTGLATLFDFTKRAPYNIQMVTDFLQNEEVKRALGVKLGVGFNKCSDEVHIALFEDVMKSMKYQLEFLVKKSKVLLYQGQYDLWDGVASNEEWVMTMKWEEIGKFLSAERKVWKVNEELAGYVQKWKSLSNVVVFGAGHLVPVDEPLNAQKMIEDWVLDKGLFEKVLEVNLSSVSREFSLFD